MKMKWTNAIIWIAHFIGLVAAQVGIVSPPRDVLDGKFNSNAEMLCKLNATVPKCVWRRNGGKITFEDSSRYHFINQNGSNTSDCSIRFLCLRPIDIGNWTCSHELGSDHDKAPSHTAKIVVETQVIPENYSNDSCSIPNQNSTGTVGATPKDTSPKAVPTNPTDNIPKTVPTSTTDHDLVKGLSTPVLIGAIIATTVIMAVVVTAITTCCYLHKKAAILRSQAQTLAQYSDYRQQQRANNTFSITSTSMDDSNWNETVDSLGYLRPIVSNPAIKKDRHQVYTNVSDTTSYHHYDEIQYGQASQHSPSA